jgi:hypothetical protein
VKQAAIIATQRDGMAISDLDLPATSGTVGSCFAGEKKRSAHLWSQSMFGSLGLLEHRSRCSMLLDLRFGNYKEMQETSLYNLTRRIIIIGFKRLMP